MFLQLKSARKSESHRNFVLLDSTDRCARIGHFIYDH